MLLAKANFNDSSGMLPLILWSCFAIAAAGFFASLPIRFARLRNHRFAQAILLFSLLWAALAAGSVIYTLFLRARFDSQQLELSASGFLDVSVKMSPPPWPWPMWGCLAAAYVVLLFFSIARQPASPSAPRNPS